MTKNIFLAVVLVVGVSSVSFSQPDYTHMTGNLPSGEGFIRRYKDRRTVMMEPPCEMILLQFSASPSGKLMYLTKTERFVDGKGGFRAFFSHEHSPLSPPDPSIISMELHVCDESGNDLTVVPISEIYQTSYCYGEFLSEDVVRLWIWGRASGEIANLIVNLKTGALYGWGEDAGIAAFPSPDAERIACVIWRPDGNSLLAVNGAQIYPFRAERVPDASMTREEYQGFHANITAWLKEHPGRHSISTGGMGWNRLDDSSPWSPDRRHLVLFSLPADGIKPDVLTTRTAEMLVFDVDRALDLNSGNNYMTRVQTDLPIVSLYDSGGTRPVIQWPSAAPGKSAAATPAGENAAAIPPFQIKWQKEPDKTFRPKLINGN